MRGKEEGINFKSETFSVDAGAESAETLQDRDEREGRERGLKGSTVEGFSGGARNDFGAPKADFRLLRDNGSFQRMN